MFGFVRERVGWFGSPQQLNLHSVSSPEIKVSESPESGEKRETPRAEQREEKNTSSPGDESHKAKWEEFTAQLQRQEEMFAYLKEISLQLKSVQDGISRLGEKIDSLTPASPQKSEPSKESQGSADDSLVESELSEENLFAADDVLSAPKNFISASLKSRKTLSSGIKTVNFNSFLKQETGEESENKTDSPAAEAKADSPAAEAKAAEAKADSQAAEAKAAEAKADSPAVEAKADSPAAEAKADSLAAEAKADSPAAEAKADSPAAEMKVEERKEFPAFSSREENLSENPTEASSETKVVIDRNIEGRRS